MEDFLIGEIEKILSLAMVGCEILRDVMGRQHKGLSKNWVMRASLFQ